MHESAHDIEVLNSDSTVPLLLICDHASNRVPDELNDLGLSHEELSRHIGWDIGAADVARLLAHRLGATAVLARVSRLVIDPNRDPADPTSIPTVSDRVSVPGNCDLGEAERRRRHDRYFSPYHAAIESHIARLRRRHPAPIVFSVHSFTPDMPGQDRPWHIGVLWNEDARIARPVIDGLRAHQDALVVGDNEPYSGKLVAYTLNRHGGGNHLPHCAVEIRQDLIADAAGTQHWADILEPILRALVGDGV